MICTGLFRANGFAGMSTTVALPWLYDAERTLITFRAPDELLSLPADTWRSGDVIRYYYKQPDQALRLMNVTKTDLNKAGE